MIAVRVVVRGRVQGVGYRYAMVEAATEAGARGWVRNRNDGTVEALVQGESAVVDAIVAWCRRGPPAAHVTSVDVELAAPESHATRFTTKPTS
jgi:acylphosphatase